MPDPNELFPAIGGSVLVVRLLGPTTEYLGTNLQQWTARRAENIRRVFQKAADKLGPDLEKDGAVPPRVLKGILEEGQFADDELVAEYLAGVLASSRTSDARDDRGAALTALVGRLSTYQLRAHYVMYATARRALVGDDINLGMEAERRVRPMFLSYRWIFAACGLTQDEADDFAAINSHIISGLVREQLIEEHYAYGGEEHRRAQNGARRAPSGAEWR